MRSRLLLTAVLLLASVSVAHAEEIDFWNFRGGMPKEANSNGLTTAEVTEEGLFLRTNSEGIVNWIGQPLEGPADVVTLRVRSSRAVNAFFVWAPTNEKDQGSLYQVPFTIPVTEIARDIDVVLSNYDTWDWRTQTLGIVFPAGSELILEEMNFRRWTPMEKLIEGWKSFWTFDDFKPYSINFLWGPLVAGNEPARMTLFEHLPPFAWSATRFFYAFLIVAAACALFAAYLRGNRALGLGIFAAAFCALWLVFDLRMGAEILSYAADDMRTYVLADKDERMLRSHGALYAIFEEVLPEIRKHERYALLSKEGTVAYPNLRYLSYPSVAVLPGQDMAGVRLFVVFGDTSVKVDAQNRLFRQTGTGTEILSPPGRIIKRIHDSIFLFETTQP